MAQRFTIAASLTIFCMFPRGTVLAQFPQPSPQPPQPPTMPITPTTPIPQWRPLPVKPLTPNSPVAPVLPAPVRPVVFRPQPLAPITPPPSQAYPWQQPAQTRPTPRNAPPNGMATPPLYATPPQIPQPLQFGAAPQQQEQPQSPTQWLAPVPKEIRLPQAEIGTHLDGIVCNLRHNQQNWEIWSGRGFIRSFGTQRTDADEAMKFLRDLRPTDWYRIGTDRVIVEYGLNQGKATIPNSTLKLNKAIDLKTARIENIRGVWCLRDDQNILLNCGLQQADAEQTLAVCQKYGFNHIGAIGNSASAMMVLYSQPAKYVQVGQTSANNGMTPEFLQMAQEGELKRTGIPVPGVGYVGERIVIDPRKVQTRRTNSQWELVYGDEVLAKFGMSEWSARDALKLVQDLRFTELCRFNEEISFFLVNGQAPQRVPFAVHSLRFVNDNLRVSSANGGKWGIYEGRGRLLLSLSSETEANQLVKLIQHYGFDQICQQGLSSRVGLKFFAKSR